MAWKRWLPHVTTLLLAALLVLTQQVWAGPVVTRLTAATAGTSKTTINYQGYLTDSGGSPMNGVPLDMVFRLYNVETGGTALWTEPQTVTPTNGLFSVLLGSVTAIPTSAITNNSDLWLGITVGGDVNELSPREKLASSPYAMLANVPDNSITQAKLANNSVTSAKIASGAVTQVHAPSLIRALSTNSIIMTGEANLNMPWLPPNGIGTLDVTFSQPCPSACDALVLTVNAYDDPHIKLRAGFRNLSRTGFTLVLWNQNDSVTLATNLVHWLVIGH